MSHWFHISLLEMVSRALLPIGMGWLADRRCEGSVHPDGPEVAEEYPSVVALVHRVRYLEQRVTSSERRTRKLAVELTELRACLDAPFEKRKGAEILEIASGDIIRTG